VSAPLPYRYYVHGVGIQSEVPLGLPYDESVPPDLTIRFTDDDVPPSAAADEELVRYDGGATYRIAGGARVTAYMQPPADEAALEFLTGPAIAIALFQRGCAVLHASCINVGNQLVAFVGQSGAGKSVMAAALIRRGHKLVADDFIAFSGDGFIHHGIPRIRLWPEAARSLGMHDATLPDKLAITVDGHTQVGSTPLVFLLTSGFEDTITPLRRHDTLYQLLSNSYCVSLLESLHMAGEFTRWSNVARAIECYQLTRKQGMDRVDETAELIEQFVSCH
jgi:hypothetical protein